jgi:predicted nucleic acid-binding protein
MAEQRRAFLDANVLRGQLTTDVLLTLAYDDRFEPRWSQGVLDEVRRNRPPNLPEASIDRRIATMNKAFPQAMVTDYEHLAPQMQADDKDKHVLAAAVRSESNVLVTENVKDFDPPVSGPHAMKVERTSEFLNRILDEDQGRTVAAMEEMVSRTSREPNSLSGLIDKMADQHDLRGFAHKLNSVVPESDRGTHPNLQAAQSMRAAMDGVAPASGAAGKPATTPQATKATRGQESTKEKEL